jgi:phytol kinase
MSIFQLNNPACLMNTQLFYALLFLLFFLLFIYISHVLYKKYKLPVDHSRKFLHISGGLLALFFPLFLHSHWWVLLLCTLALLLLLVTFLIKELPAIHRTERTSIGSIIFPIPVYICFLSAEKFENNLLFFLPISLLTIADPAAEWGGKKWGHKTKSFFGNQKTGAGTLSFAITALLLSVLWTALFHLPVAKELLLIFSITLISTAAEFISLKGIDNITVPLFSLGTLLILLYL